jgi:predicted neuraminidase
MPWSTKNSLSFRFNHQKQGSLLFQSAMNWVHTHEFNMLHLGLCVMYKDMIAIQRFVDGSHGSNIFIHNILQMHLQLV